MPSLNTGNAILSNAIAVDSSYNVSINGSIAIGAASASTFKAYIVGDVFGATGFYTRNTADTFLGSSNNGSGIIVNGTTLVTKIVSGGNTVATFASTGAATFSSSVTASGSITLIGGNATNNTENAIAQLYDANSNLMGRIVGYRGANGNEGNLRIYTNNVTPTLAMTLTNTGNVGIGTSSPSALLHLGVANASVDGTKGVKITNPAGTTVMLECGVNSDSFVGTTSASNFSIRTANSPNITITSGGQIVMGRTTPSGSGRLTVDGDFYLHNITSGAGQSTLKYNYTSTGLVTYDTSSRLLKNDIENLSYGLDDVLKMSAKKYKWKRDDSIDLGFIADEMVQIIPEIVFFSTEMTNETTGVPIGEPLSINYDRLIPVLVKAIQEQNEIITKQGQAIEELKALINK